MKRRSLFQILGLIPAISLAGVSVAVVSDVKTIKDQLSSFDSEDQEILRSILKRKNISLDEECLSTLALMYRMSTKNVAKSDNGWRHDYKRRYSEEERDLDRIYYKYAYEHNID